MRVLLVALTGFSLAGCTADPAMYPGMPYQSGSGPAYGDEGAAAYGAGGYAPQPGYYAPGPDGNGAYGYAAPGYAAPGYAAPGYAPGYVTEPVLVPGVSLGFGLDRPRRDRERWEHERGDRDRFNRERFERERVRDPGERAGRPDIRPNSGERFRDRTPERPREEHRGRPDRPGDRP